MRRSWQTFGASLGLLGLAACGEPEAAPAGESPAAAEARALASGDSSVGGDIVATVDGVGIGVADVEALARAEQLAPLEALRRLEGELLLARASERAGAGDVDEADAEARRAAVRALLHRVIEPAHTPEGVSAETLDARHREIASALSAPETRRAGHALVQLPADAPEARVDAAMRLAQRIRGELATLSDPEAALDRYAGTEGAFEVAVEHLPAMAHERLERSFADALFGAAAPGLLPGLVRTSYGVHVIVLAEIVPPWEVPREEWEPTLRRQIAAEARARATEELAEQLRERAPVSVSARVGDLLETISFGDPPGAAPPGGS